MLFGLPMQDTGFKRYPLRSRSRIIQYAITIVLKQNDKEFLKSLKTKLLQYYPPLKIDHHKNSLKTDEKSSVTYIYYPGEFKMWEFLPLIVAFVLLFTYFYFSVKKYDMIRSRLLLAICAVFTVLGSLVMSLGLCFFFGLTISLQSKDIFPYLVILVGLENCLVITKSVVSTDDTFDVKIRVAQALSKEGWHISKTLMTEITILTMGLATFVPVIQEFSVFAIVGLLSDYMLQMLLFSTILAMNIKRTEYSNEIKHRPKMMLSFTNNSNSYNSLHNSNHSLHQNGGYGFFNHNRNSSQDFRFFANNSAAGDISPPPFMNSSYPTVGSSHFYRSQSHPKLSFADLNSHPADGSKRSSIALTRNDEKSIPKRLKVVNFWVRTRFFQRAFMVWMIVWIGSIVYNSGYLEQLFVVDSNRTSFASEHLQRKMEAGRGAVSSFFSNVQYAIHSAAGSSGFTSSKNANEASFNNGKIVNDGGVFGSHNAGHDGKFEKMFYIKIYYS